MNPQTEILYLNRSDLKKVGGDRSEIYVEAIHEAFIQHAKSNYVQPLKPYLRVPEATNIADRIISMPAYIGGENAISGMKWIGSKHDNLQKRGLERASGVIILNDPESNYPVAILEAGLISSMRTAAVSAVAAKYLAKSGFQTLTILGCGLIAKRHITTMLEQFPKIKSVYVYDVVMEGAEMFVNEMRAQTSGVTFLVEKTAQEATEKGEVIITCTVTDQPYLKWEWLQKGSFVSNISIMDVNKEVFLLADKVIVDDWDQANREKKIIHQLVLEGQFSKEALYAELGEIVIGEKKGREHDDEIIILNPMGMAIEDVACAQCLYEKSLANKVGLSLSLY